jgi:HEAT repeat protein
MLRVAIGSQGSRLTQKQVARVAEQLQDQDPGARQQAVIALTGMDAHLTESQIEVVLRQLGEKEESRQEAINLLSTLGTKLSADTIRKLVQGLRQPVDFGRHPHYDALLRLHQAGVPMPVEKTQ